MIQNRSMLEVKSDLLAIPLVCVSIFYLVALFHILTVCLKLKQMCGKVSCLSIADVNKHTHSQTKHN